MELKGAKKVLHDWNKAEEVTIRDPKSIEFRESYIERKEAIETIIQELDRLQKENEELKNIDLTTVHIKGVCDEKERWRNKIRKKIEECKKFIIDDENFSPLHQNDKELLEELLKEE